MCPMRIRTAAASMMFIATLAGTAIAETDYRDFYSMDENARGGIISETALPLIEEARVAGKEIRALCVSALLFSSEFNPIQGRFPEGWNALNDVIAYERRSMENFEHNQSIEDAIRMIAELYCPIDMK